MFFFKKNKPFETPATFTDTPPSVGKTLARSVLELVQVAALVTAIVLPIRYFLIQPFYVKGASMEPNFYDKEYLIIDEITYRFREPARGEIIVLRYPNDPSQFFIKRVIGIPGDTVTVSNGSVSIANKDTSQAVTLDEGAYLSPEVKTMGQKTETLRDGEYFVLGDNRSASLDSRIFGAVPREDVVGRVMLRGWPLGKIAWFETPKYKF